VLAIKQRKLYRFLLVLPYAGYRYLICFSHITDVGHDYEKINTDNWGVFENPNVTTVGLACAPDKTISKKIAQTFRQDIDGHVKYFGDTVTASANLDERSTIFFHENYAWSWYAWINNTLHLPRKVNNVFIGFDLQPGHYEVTLRYIDPFFILALMITLAYLFLYFVWYKIKRTSS